MLLLFRLRCLVLTSVGFGGVLTDTTSQGCNATKPSDIIFVLDASGSVGATSFKKTLGFVQKMVNSFPIGPAETHVGLVTFDSWAYLQFHLNKYTDKQTIKKAVASTRYTSGATDTSAALKYLRETSFTTQNGMRPEAAKIAIIVTDGQSYNPNATASEAALLLKTGVTVFCIGVGSYADINELNAMATDPDATHVFQVIDFSSLITIKNSLATKTCEAISTATTTIATPTNTLTTTTPPVTTAPTTALSKTTTPTSTVPITLTTLTQTTTTKTATKPQSTNPTATTKTNKTTRFITKLATTTSKTTTTQMTKTIKTTRFTAKPTKTTSIATLTPMTKPPSSTSKPSTSNIVTAPSTMQVIIPKILTVIPAVAPISKTTNIHEAPMKPSEIVLNVVAKVEASGETTHVIICVIIGAILSGLFLTSILIRQCGREENKPPFKNKLNPLNKAGLTPVERLDF